MTPTSYEARLRELGLELPPFPKPQGVYKPLVQVNNQVYLSGHGPLRPDGTFVTGRLGAELDLDAGKAAARLVGLAILTTLRNYLGTLDRVRRLIKTLGLVNCTPEFTQHPQVINGASELMAELFGLENGIGARSAFGAVSIPGGWPVEIEMIFEIE
jgi:enamine deaminase RidA (YjgF/YER057c/UK114 family)